jgi:hypothetical protein
MESEGNRKRWSPLPFISLWNPLSILYDTVMTTKEIALRTIEQLPDSVSWEDIQRRISFIADVHKGLCELDEGKGIPHDKVKEEFAHGKRKVV